MAALASPALDEPQPGDVPSLWLRWRAGQETARDEIARLHAPWVRSVARRIFVRVRGRGDDWQDYLQNAMLGMLEAMRTFDVERGVPFEAFAQPRIRGAVFDGLRHLKSSHAVTSPWIEERLASFTEGDDAYDPVDRLIAILSGMATGHVLEFYGEGTEASPLPGPYESAVRSQLGERLSSQLRRLGDRERIVIEWHYLRHLSFAHIAEVLALSKGRVSQLHRQALDRLRERMMHDRWQQSL